MTNIKYGNVSESEIDMKQDMIIDLEKVISDEMFIHLKEGKIKYIGFLASEENRRYAKIGAKFKIMPQEIEEEFNAKTLNFKKFSTVKKAMKEYGNEFLYGIDDYEEGESIFIEEAGESDLKCLGIYVIELEKIWTK